MLLGRIIPNQQDRWRVVHIPHARGHFWLARKRSGEGREVGSAVVVDVIRSEHHTRELLKQVILFVRRAGRAHNSDCPPALTIANFFEARSDQFKSLFPGRRRKSAIFADQRLREPILMVRKIEGVTSLDTEKIAVDPALVAIVATNNFHPSVCPP